MTPGEQPQNQEAVELPPNVTAGWETERSLTTHSVLRGQGAAFLTRGLSEGERPRGHFV